MTGDGQRDLMPAGSILTRHTGCIIRHLMAIYPRQAATRGPGCLCGNIHWQTSKRHRTVPVRSLGKWQDHLAIATIRCMMELNPNTFGVREQKSVYMTRREYYQGLCCSSFQLLITGCYEAGRRQTATWRMAISSG